MGGKIALSSELFSQLLCKAESFLLYYLIKYAACGSTPCWLKVEMHSLLFPKAMIHEERRTYILSWVCFLKWDPKDKTNKSNYLRTHLFSSFRIYLFSYLSYLSLWYEPTIPQTMNSGKSKTTTAHSSSIQLCKSRRCTYHLSFHLWHSHTDLAEI